MLGIEVLRQALSISAQLRVERGYSPFARTLFLHSDNCSENKNRFLFAYLQLLVMKGYFDEIYVHYFMPGMFYSNADFLIKTSYTLTQSSCQIFLSLRAQPRLR